MSAISRHDRLAIPLALVLALAFCALLALQPMGAAALVLLCLAALLAYTAPVANLTLILFLTMIVPGGVQKALAIGAGTGLHGLFPSDILLFAGLVRAAPELMRMQLERRRLVVSLAVVLFLCIALVQMLHGFAAGWDRREAGGECRVLLYFATFLLALPILADERARGRLLKSLVGLGLVLGLWGIFQWLVGAGAGLGDDVGLRPGVRLTSGGRGQVQGGLFAFPVALVITAAVLASGQIRSARGRALLLAVAGVNAISLLFTYERSFWICALLATGFVVVKVNPRRRGRVLAGIGSFVAMGLLSLSLLAPSLLTVARERLFSVAQARKDDSVRYRLVESRHVVDKIRDHPLIGSGLGATIFWGRPWEHVPARSTHFIHNGYLALAWKLGMPSALLVLSLLAWAVLARGPPRWGPLHAALRTGCQGGLLALLIVGITFSSFMSIQIAGAIGLMLAVCATPRAHSASHDSDAAGAISAVV
jgi:hypothetical protein